MVRIPTRKQRLLTVPILIVTVGIALVRLDLIFANKLPFVLLAAVAYVCLEILFKGARRIQK